MKILAFLGKSGSGKGTQAERLAERYNLRIISSGNLLRARMQEEDYVGKRIKEILDRGGLIPTPVIFHLWLHELEVVREEGKKDGIIFEGSPRYLSEAKMLQDTLEFYDLDGSFIALHLYISDEEAMRRLLERARHDDDRQAIQSRLDWFAKEVMQSVEYYRGQDKLIEINGEQSRDDVEQEILQKLQGFFVS